MVSNCIRLLRSGVNIVGNMNFVSFRELRSSTGKINEMLADDGKIVVTNKGKPAAIMLKVNETDIEETLSLINQVNLSKAINNIRLAALRNGKSEMTMEEIDAEIEKSRQERRQPCTGC